MCPPMYTANINMANEITITTQYIQQSQDIETSDRDNTTQIKISNNHNDNLKVDMASTSGLPNNDNNQDTEMSDEDDYCPSEFGVSDDEEIDNDPPSWEDDSTFVQDEDTLLQKSTERPLLSWDLFARLPTEIQQQIFGYVCPTTYGEVKRRTSKRDRAERAYLSRHRNSMVGTPFQPQPMLAGFGATQGMLGMGTVTFHGIPGPSPMAPQLAPVPAPAPAPQPLAQAATTGIAEDDDLPILINSEFLALPVERHKEGAMYRHDEPLIAPQILRVSKAVNLALTEVYFGSCAFPAFIQYSHSSESSARSLPALLRWNRVYISPEKEYPLSFDCVKELDIHIRLTMENTSEEEIWKFRNGLRELAKIFEPGRAPRKLRKLTLKFHVENGVYWELNGTRWDHVSPRNVVREIKMLCEPFYVFGGKGNGGGRSKEERELVWPGMERKMDGREEVEKVEESGLGAKKTVEVDVDVAMNDGWIRRPGEHVTFWNNPQTYDQFLNWN